MRTTALHTAVTMANALSHPARLRVVAMLHTGELCACQITTVLGLASSTVSAHLKDLKHAGLIVERKDGRWVHFSLSSDDLPQRWIDLSLESITNDPQRRSDLEKVAELRTLSVEDLCRFGYEEARARAASTTTRKETK